MVSVQYRVLRNVFGPKWEEVIGEWKNMYNEEIHDLYCLSNIIRVIIKEDEMGRACGTYRVLKEKPEGKGSLGNDRHR